MGKIIIHIGLPKTATTSLQIDFFPKLNKKDINYIGINQPREGNNNALFLQFMKSINTGKEIEVTRSLLEKRLIKGENILLSEEMLVVSDINKTWKEKLFNLSDIINSLNYCLIVTVREPVSAMFSYYVGYYQLEYKNINKSFNEIVFEEERMEIFHYNKFFTYMFSLFNENRIEIEKFENITSNDFRKLAQILNVNLTSIAKLELKNHNSRNRNESYILQGYNVNLGDFLFKKIKRVNIYKYLPKSLLHFLFFRIFSSINKVNISKEEKIKKPNERGFHLIKERLYNETKFLNDRYNIDYISNIHKKS